MTVLKEYRSLLPYLSKYKYQYIIGIFFLIMVDAAQIAIPQFLRIIIDMIESGDFDWNRIIILCLWMIAIMALVCGGRFLWRYFINGSSRRIEAHLREKLYSHTQKQAWDFFQKNKIGDLMARSINDLHAVRMSIGMGIVALFDFVFMASAIFIIIFIQDASSALAAIIPLPFITILILVFGSMVGRKFKAVQETYSKMSENVQEAFSGISVIKSFVKEWWFIKKFADSNDDYRKANMILVRLFGFFFPFVTFLSSLTILIMLVIGGIRVINGEMTSGSLIAMFRYLSMLIWPLMGAGFMVNIIQRGAVSLGRVNEILNTQPSIRNEEVKVGNEKLEEIVSVKSHSPAVEIRHLDFSYGDKKVLEDINISIERGQWIGVMGRTGSGKTTLLKTLMRMADPPFGTVSVFGLDVKNWQIENLRSVFAVSPQDSYLFSDTIANNITYGITEDFLQNRKDTKEINDLKKYINIASLNKDLEVFQNGGDTLVGERGLTLSGGQKQRTAIARAAIMDAEILVLDDSLCAVDNETESKIIQGLWEERKGRTTIIVSHRVSTLKYADNILVLDKGKVLEYGSPSSLKETGGFYSRMAKFQSLETGEALG